MTLVICRVVLRIQSEKGYWRIEFAQTSHTMMPTLLCTYGLNIRESTSMMLKLRQNVLRQEKKILSSTEFYCSREDWHVSRSNFGKALRWPKFFAISQKSKGESRKFLTVENRPKISCLIFAFGILQNLPKILAKIGFKKFKNFENWQKFQKFGFKKFKNWQKFRFFSRFSTYSENSEIAKQFRYIQYFS